MSKNENKSGKQKADLLTIYSVKELITIFQGINHKISELLKIASDNFLTVTNLTKKILEIVKSQPGEEMQIMQSERKKKIYQNSVSNITTNIQYHDIIRQKLECIEQVHEELMSELAVIDGSEIILENTEYITIIPEIAELDLAQLEYLTKEYDNAVSQIRNNLLAIKEIDQTTFTNQFDLTGDVDQIEIFRKSVAEITPFLKEISSGSIIQKGEVGEQHKENKLKQIKLRYTMDEERRIFDETFTGLHGADQDIQKNESTGFIELF